MGRIKEMLEDIGYTARERYNFYAGLAIPAVAVTSAVYFGLLKGNPAEDPLYVTLGKGAFALACNINLAPLELSIGAGLARNSITHLREKEKVLEQEVLA